MKTVRVWVSEYGVRRIPEKFRSLRFTKSGWFDGRRGKSYYAEFKRWLGGVS